MRWGQSKSRQNSEGGQQVQFYKFVCNGLSNWFGGGPNLPCPILICRSELSIFRQDPAWCIMALNTIDYRHKPILNLTLLSFFFHYRLGMITWDSLFAYKAAPKTPGVGLDVGVAQLQPKISYCLAWFGYQMKVTSVKEICAFLLVHTVSK